MVRIAASAPSAMPMPPTRGTGRACTLRASGRSTMPRCGASRISIGMMAMLTASAVVTARSSLIGSARNVLGEERTQLRSKFGETRVGRLDRLARPQRRHQPHQRAVAALAREQVPEQRRFHFVFPGEGALALLEPVIDELPRFAFLDDDA